MDFGKQYDKVMFIDIDGTLCENVPNEKWSKMPSAEPWMENIDKLKRWKEEGAFICLFSSRLEAMRSYTEQWLIRYKVPYDLLILNKPRLKENGEYYFIDNHKVRGITSKNKIFTDLVSTTKDILVFHGD